MAGLALAVGASIAVLVHFLRSPRSRPSRTSSSTAEVGASAEEAERAVEDAPGDEPEPLPEVEEPPAPPGTNRYGYCGVPGQNYLEVQRPSLLRYAREHD